MVVVEEEVVVFGPFGVMRAAAPVGEGISFV